jgi:hypothetical protein
MKINKSAGLKKITLYLLLIFFGTSCSPKMHAIGAGMRLFSLSQNKYSPKNPYVKGIKKNKKIKAKFQ